MKNTTNDITSHLVFMLLAAGTAKVSCKKVPAGTMVIGVLPVSLIVTLVSMLLL